MHQGPPEPGSSVASCSRTRPASSPHAALAVGAAILAESTLSFLGFGLQPPAGSWGSMLAQAKGTVGTPRAYLVYFPGLAILITVLAVNAVGDGLRHALAIPRPERHRTPTAPLHRIYGVLLR